MDKEQEDFIKTLQDNVAFQLSLTSKELFHSNFLAWLAEDENTTDIFNELLKNCFGVKDWTFNAKKMMVKREYKNFDLCICEKIENEKKDKVEIGEDSKYIPGHILFVLENKFKSLPYKEQLKIYEDKVKEENRKVKKGEMGDKETKFVLLSLSDNFPDNGIWKFVTYKKYITALEEANKDYLNGTDKGMINKYCEFIKIFSDHIQKCMLEEICDNIGIKIGAQWSSLINHQELYAIRCNDVWQKIVMQHCALFLAQEVKKTFGKDQEVTMAHSDKDIWGKDGTENKGKLFTMVNFFHGEAFLELKYLIPSKGILAFQQQGNNPLRIGILAMNANNGITPSLKKKDLQAWEDNVHKHIKECGLSEHIVLKEEDVASNKVFHSYGSFYYCNLKEEIPPIEQTLKDIVNKMKELVPIIDSLTQTDK